MHAAIGAEVLADRVVEGTGAGAGTALELDDGRDATAWIELA